MLPGHDTARLCVCPSQSDKFTHLSNNSIQKYSDEFYNTDIKGNMWECSDFKKLIIEQTGEDLWTTKVQPRMKDIVVWSCQSVQDMVRAVRDCLRGARRVVAAVFSQRSMYLCTCVCIGKGATALCSLARLLHVTLSLRLVVIIVIIVVIVALLCVCGAVCACGAGGGSQGVV